MCRNFSFLHGASHPEELIAQAARLGLSGVTLIDRNSLAGVVRAHMAAKEAGIAYAPGYRLVFADKTPDIPVWPEDRKVYGNLCELLTLGKRRAPKGGFHLMLDDFLALGRGLLMAVLPGARLDKTLTACLTSLKQAYPDYVHLALVRRYGSTDQRRMAHITETARRLDIPTVAVGDVLYHHPDRWPLQDVLTCIREHAKLTDIGRRLEPNAERHLHAPEEMFRLFAGSEAALIRTQALFKRIRFSLDELRYQYPEGPIFEELGGIPLPSQQALEKLVAIGLERRYPDGAPQKVLAAIAHETQLIAKLAYAPYFLTVYDIVRFARSQGILCQGRGSVANSVVCYCLGITEVDPEKVDLLFERFISEERQEPPDVDFEHERREEVIQYIYRKYGRERAGLTATVIIYRARSTIRDVGKVFELSEDAITALSGTRWGSSSRDIGLADVERAGLNSK